MRQTERQTSDETTTHFVLRVYKLLRRLYAHCWKVYYSEINIFYNLIIIWRWFNPQSIGTPAGDGGGWPYGVKVLAPRVVGVAVYSLCDVHVSAGSGGVQGDPSLVIWLIDAGTVFHQECHHVHVIIYTRLEITHTRTSAQGEALKSVFHNDDTEREEIRAKLVITLKWPLRQKWGSHIHTSAYTTAAQIHLTAYGGWGGGSNMVLLI